MGFRCGIIGLPNVGKSTLFNALTKLKVEASNFPFCTISPNIGIVSVPDPRLEKLRKIVNPKRIIPTTMKFIDIAGLIEGSSHGEGLGNQFLTNIRDTEAIIHVVRCFKKDTIIHVTGEINPVNDINIINLEMILSDLENCHRAINRLKKLEKLDNKKSCEKEALEKCLFHLENAKTLRLLSLTREEIFSIQHFNFLTLKPIMYVANVSEDGFKNNIYLEQVKNIAKHEHALVVPVCALLESDIAILPLDESQRFIAELGLKEQSLNRIIHAGYRLLKLQTFFTAGIKEVHAWTIPSGATALQAAGKIHTDFKKGFIRAQTIAFEDFIKYKGERGAKEAGKIRLEGKDYIVKDGDILYFLSSC